MSTPSPFFNDCVDLEAGDAAFDPNYPYPAATGGECYNFASHAGDLGPNYQQTAASEMMEQGHFEENPYGEYDNQVDLDYDSTTTGMNSSTTPNTQASTRTASTSGSNVESQSSSKSRKGSHHSSSHRHSHSHAESSIMAEVQLDAGSKKRPGRKSTKPKPQVVEEDAKRNKFLERNRIAASKCRQKKKEWVSGLEDQRGALESRHSHLQMEYNGLLGQVSGLKEELMSHANCNDPNINQWLENEARKFVQGTSDKLTGGHRRGSHSSRRHSSMSSTQPTGGGSGYGTIDPMLRGQDDDISFSPTTGGSEVFDDGSGMYGPGR